MVGGRRFVGDGGGHDAAIVVDIPQTPVFWLSSKLHCACVTGLLKEGRKKKTGWGVSVASTVSHKKLSRREGWGQLLLVQLERI